MTPLPLDFDGPSNHSFIPFPVSALEQSVLDRFRAIANRHAQRLAIDDGRQRLTYGEVCARVERIAATLAARLPPGDDPVAILLDQEADFPVAMLGVLAAGRAYVPLDVGFPLERNRRILHQAGIAALVTCTARIPRATDIRPPQAVLIDLDRLEPGTAPATLAPTADSLAYILYTSGSTGEPKGVCQNHRNLLHDVLQYTNAIHLSADDRLTMLYSGSVSGAIRDVYGALLNGASLHILPFKTLGPQGIRDALSMQGITVYHSVPTLFRQLIATLSPSQRLTGIRLGYLAGDRLDVADVTAFRRHFPVEALLYTGLGSTENATICRHWFIRPETPLDGERLPVGRAIPDREVRLVGENGETVAEGEIGEIQVTSRYLALGYWRAPELTEQCFAVAPQDPLARIFKTGDLGRLRPDGLLEFMGRKDHQVKIRGFRVELGAIETALKDLPSVADAAVVAREDATGELDLAAYLVLETGYREDAPGLSRMLRARLPDFMIPASFTILECLPLTSNGKLDRRALPKPEAADSHGREVRVAPQAGTEQRLTALWAEVLGIQRADPQDHFFELGGDSLSAIQLISRIEQNVGCSLSLSAVFAYPTPARLAKHVETLRWLRDGVEGDGYHEVEL